jgi:hypothetical protein
MGYNGSPDGRDGGSAAPGCFLSLIVAAVVGGMLWAMAHDASDPRKLRVGDLAKDRLTGEVGMISAEPSMPFTRYAIRYKDGRVKWHERPELIKILPNTSPKTIGEPSTKPYNRSEKPADSPLGSESIDQTIPQTPATTTTRR